MYRNMIRWSFAYRENLARLWLSDPQRAQKKVVRVFLVCCAFSFLCLVAAPLLAVWISPWFLSLLLFPVSYVEYLVRPRALIGYGWLFRRSKANENRLSVKLGLFGFTMRFSRTDRERATANLSEWLAHHGLSIPLQGSRPAPIPGLFLTLLEGVFNPIFRTGHMAKLLQGSTSQVPVAATVTRRL